MLPCGANHAFGQIFRPVGRLFRPGKRERGPEPSFPCAHPCRSGKRYGRTMRIVVGSLVTLSTTEASAITPLPATTVTFAYPRLRFV